jgi:hypothetical protein
MLLGAAVVRPFVAHRAHNAGLSILPSHGSYPGHFAQPRIHAVGCDQKPSLDGGAVGQMDTGTRAAAFESRHRQPFDDVDAKLRRAPPQRSVQHLVVDHVRERLARRHLASEGQENGANRVGRARIGDDHFGDRLRLRRDLGPAAELVEHAAGGCRYRRSAAILFPYARRRGIDDADGHAGARALQGDSDGEPDIAGAGHQNVQRRWLRIS